MLLNQMRQDAANGQGFCLIDPHGDLASAAAVEAGKDTLVWDVADPACPLGYNPLSHVSAAYRPLVASGLIEALKQQWSDAWGARMEHLLRYALLALLELPKASLQDVLPLFIDKEFRATVLAQVTDPQVQRFWRDEYAAMRYQTSIDGVAPIANKLGAFLAHPVVREAVCAPRQPLRFRKLMDEGQTLIVNLAKGRVGSDVANVIGGLVVASFAQAAYSRQNLPEADRNPYFLYIDEFSTFTTGAFAGMLSELRKYRLGMVLSTQFLAQMPETAREATFGNVGTYVVFRVGSPDADILARQLGGNIPYARDLVSLDNYECFVQLMNAGHQTKAFSARTILK